MVYFSPCCVSSKVAMAENLGDRDIVLQYDIQKSAATTIHGRREKEVQFGNLTISSLLMRIHITLSWTDCLSRSQGQSDRRA